MRRKKPVMRRCSACTQLGHSRTGCPNVYGPRAPSRPMAYNEETNALRSDLLDATGRIPQMPGQLIRKVQTLWGDGLCERRLWRLLAWLLERRYVRRVRCEDTGLLQGYVRNSSKKLEISERTCSACSEPGHYAKTCKEAA